MLSSIKSKRPISLPHLLLPLQLHFLLHFLETGGSWWWWFSSHRLFWACLAQQKPTSLWRGGTRWWYHRSPSAQYSVIEAKCHNISPSNYRALYLSGRDKACWVGATEDKLSNINDCGSSNSSVITHSEMLSYSRTDCTADAAKTEFFHYPITHRCLVNTMVTSISGLYLTLMDFLKY